MAASFLGFEAALGSTTGSAGSAALDSSIGGASAVGIRGRAAPSALYMDPLRSVQMTPSGSYLANSVGSPTGHAPTSPRLMRAATPRRMSFSPSASSTGPAATAASPRAPRFAVSLSGADPQLSLSASYRGTPTVASSQNFSTASGFSYASSGLSSTPTHHGGHHNHLQHTPSGTANRFGTPVRVGTPVRMAPPPHTPPTVRLHHGGYPSSNHNGSRPASPSSASSTARLQHQLQQAASSLRARSPVLMQAGSGAHVRASTPSSPLVPSQPGTTRQLLRELAASWRNRGSENSHAFGEGGYMSAAPGDVLNHRYELIAKLGWGEFSTVWLANDRKATNLHRMFVAVKIAKCRADVTRGTKYECYLLAYIRKRVHREAPIASLVDCFEARGRYGDHLCMTMPLFGSNMLCVIEQFKARGRRRRSEKELQMVKEITVAVLRALGHLAQANILHTDLKPENVLVSAPDLKVAKSAQNFCRSRGALDADQLRALEEGDAAGPIATLADFGLSLLLEPSTTTDAHAQQVVQRKELNVPRPGHLQNDRGMLIQTREYRAPEVLLGSDFNCRTDVWSLGCMTYELLTGDFLMDPKKKTSNERDMDVEHLAMIQQILGPVPSRVATGTGKHAKRYFDANGRFLFADKYAAYPRRSIAAELETFLEPSEAERAAQFIMSCFTYDPVERCHAHDLLRHSWLRNATAASSPAAPQTANC